ncbi:putative phosphomevalonate kinase [Monocercomonoides exilis]|uniref:putative phosphomevalonate kinase n=1 Tax=Monocercomonoides exilis TaxID=2049356 RepID=UPI0035597AF5|nr:putative phosphomevalonate kinase [Monocercomonoides exilis]|eukprot:MONOS_168591.1-p1 / transcript=MONOS_168591.1 / gene=MONOS_168591 / organism=Monocercomonoides_exilis_PA203 / gene_product=phosphomevalonate / transcript_product=phosphomevalonate / location=Mono_scaffold00086:119459-121309(+) / protein_length=538 / sequence_SO=supercontig / SO=protein_coding / is_pseudo=false
MIEPNSIIVKVPGKILMSGGYLILNGDSQGIVVATQNAHFYCELKDDEIIAELQKTEEEIHIGKLTLSSPMLIKESEHYNIWRCETTKNLHFERLNIEINPLMDYFRNTSFALLRYLFEGSGTLCNFIPFSIHLTVWADDSFYASPCLILSNEESWSCSIRKHVLPQDYGINAKCEINTSNEISCSSNIGKTGLGSSACLVTSVCGALLHYFLGKKMKKDSISELKTDLCCPSVFKTQLFCASHLIHSLLQGKFGSGFDVMCCCYGSHLFQQPNALQCKPELMGREEFSGDFLRARVEDMMKIWNLPPSKLPFNASVPLFVSLCEVGSGSSTVSLSSHLKKWKTEHLEEYDQLFKKLSEINKELIEHLRDFKVEESKSEDDESNTSKCDDISSQMSSSFSFHSHSAQENFLIVLSSLFEKYRKQLLTISTKSGVPICPLLIDEVADVLKLDEDGVVAVGVPGAGGEDAFFILLSRINSLESVAKKINSICSKYKRNIVLHQPFQINTAQEFSNQIVTDGFSVQILKGKLLSIQKHGI